MKASKALRLFESAHREGAATCVVAAQLAAIEALREKVKREEAVQPKLALEEQVEAVQWASGNHPPQGVRLATAAETLRRLMDEGRRFTANGYYHSDLVAWLSSLGVEPKA